MTVNAVIELSPDGHTLRCAGDWTWSGIKSLSAHTMTWPAGHPLQIDTSEINQLDTFGAFYLRQLVWSAETAGNQISWKLPSPQHQSLFNLIDANIQQSKNIAINRPSRWFAEILGEWSVRKWKNTCQFLAFIGEVVLQLLTISRQGLRHLVKGGLKVIQTAGCQALPIIAMMSFLIGIVLAYQLGVQLRLYGADIYVVDASGIALLREFAPLMTAILVAGRTSTAFAAFIGTMKVNDELDALTTMGISPIQRLVLPRIAGLLVALPLLVIWSSVFSIFGSMVMAKGQLNIGYYAYLERFPEAVSLKNYVLGLVKTPIFALIIATVGCFQGFQAEITADSVGIKTTAAAVQAIFLIIVADAFFSILFSWQGL